MYNFFYLVPWLVRWSYKHGYHLSVPVHLRFPQYRLLAIRVYKTTIIVGRHKLLCRKYFIIITFFFFITVRTMSTGTDRYICLQWIYYGIISLIRRNRIMLLYTGPWLFTSHASTWIEYFGWPKTCGKFDSPQASYNNCWLSIDSPDLFTLINFESSRARHKSMTLCNTDMVCKK